MADATLRSDLPATDPMQQLGAALGVGMGAAPVLTQRQLARALGFAQLETMRTDPRYAGPVTLSPGPGKPAETKPLYQWLQQLVDVTWPATSGPEQETAYRDFGKALRENITDETTRHVAIKFVTRLGHLYQLAGLMARDNLLSQTKGPSTAASFLSGDLGSNRGRKYSHAADAVAALNRPQFEFTFTAHPTNTSSVDSMRSQRNLGILLTRWRTDPSLAGEVKQALATYGATPVLPMASKDRPRNSSIREEADYMLYYLGNSYTDLPAIYGSYDKALGALKDYKPETLKLGVKFHSWGSSGDKDGNKQVNADTTLYAIAAHHLDILGRYEKELATIPGMEEWKTRITNARKDCSHICDQVRMRADGKNPMHEEQFDINAAALKKAVASLDAKAFEADLEKTYATTKDPATLTLMRRVHTFGFTFGTIEYRETAEEFERVLAAMIPEYGVLLAPVFADRKELDALKKQEYPLIRARDDAGLEALTKQTEAVEARLDKTLVHIEQKRQDMLTRLLNDPAQQQVLVETFKAIGKGADKLPYSDTSTAPISYQTRKRLELARDFPNILQNQVLAECQGTSNLLEALLLQHAVAAGDKRPMLGIVPLFEDGDKLKTAPGIVKAALYNPPYNDHLHEVAAAHGEPAAQQVQLAHSDNARRNGMPAARGLIYQAHEQLRRMMSDYNHYHKNDGKALSMQFYEGGSQSDPYRGGARAISATVNEFGIHDFTKMTWQGGDLLNYLNQPMSFFRLLTRNITYSAAKLEQPGQLRPKPHPQEDRIVAALDAAKQDYVNLFKGREINDFMRAIGYLEEAPAGANTARAIGRGSSDEVNVLKIRTITYSEVLQHAGLAPTWLGTLHLRDTLGKQLGASKSPQGLQAMYASSPVLKDVLDRVLFGLVRSDMDYLDRISNHHPLMGKFREEYAAAFKLAYEAHSGKKAPELDSPAEMRRCLVDTFYPHMKDVFEDQDHFLNNARAIKLKWLPGSTSNHQLQRQLMHNALDTIYHGRLPLVDDPTYSSRYRDAINVHIAHDARGRSQ